MTVLTNRSSAKIRQIWYLQEDHTRAAFDNELTTYHEFWILLLDTFCPATLTRLKTAN